MTNLMLHGIDVPSNVRYDNTLARPLRDGSSKEKVDCIVTNPPFGDVDQLLPEYEKLIGQIATTRGLLKNQLMEALTQ